MLEFADKDIKTSVFCISRKIVYKRKIKTEEI